MLLKLLNFFLPSSKDLIVPLLLLTMTVVQTYGIISFPESLTSRPLLLSLSFSCWPTPHPVPVLSCRCKTSPMAVSQTGQSKDASPESPQPWVVPSSLRLPPGEPPRSGVCYCSLVGPVLTPFSGASSQGPGLIPTKRSRVLCPFLKQLLCPRKSWHIDWPILGPTL